RRPPLGDRGPATGSVLPAGAAHAAQRIPAQRWYAGSPVAARRLLVSRRRGSMRCAPAWAAPDVLAQLPRGSGRPTSSGPYYNTHVIRMRYGRTPSIRGRPRDQITVGLKCSLSE